MVGLIRRLRGRSGSDRGAELIELAIVLPILLLVFAAIIDFGFLFQRYEAVTNAAREGARLGALPGYSQADVQARVNQYLEASGMSSAPTPYVDLTATRTLPSGGSIPVAEVVVFYHVNLGGLGSIASLVGGGGFGSMTLRSASVMRREVGGS